MNLGELVVRELDGYIAKNKDTLTCTNVASLYFDFIKTINEFGANPDNYTGLTEFLIYRVLWHFNQQKIADKGIILASKGSLGPRNPDIIIYNSSLTPLCSVQVKSNYYKVKEDYNRHMEVLGVFPQVKIATIAFEVRDTNHLKHIEHHKRLNHQYQCLILKDNNQLIQEELNSLGLIFE